MLFSEIYSCSSSPFPLKSNNSTLRVHVGLSLCVNVIFCEKDLITKFNKVYFFFSSVAGCLIFSVNILSTAVKWATDSNERK